MRKHDTNVNTQNSDFDRFYSPTLDEIKNSLLSFSDLSLKILSHVHYYSKKKLGVCLKKYRIIAQEIGCSESQVAKTLRKAKALGLSDWKINTGRAANKISFIPGIFSIFGKIRHKSATKSLGTDYINKKEDRQLVRLVGESLGANSHQINEVGRSFDKARAKGGDIIDAQAYLSACFIRVQARCQEAEKRAISEREKALAVQMEQRRRLADDNVSLEQQKASSEALVRILGVPAKEPPG